MGSVDLNLPVSSSAPVVALQLASSRPLNLSALSSPAASSSSSSPGNASETHSASSSLLGRFVPRTFVGGVGAVLAAGALLSAAWLGWKIVVRYQTFLLLPPGTRVQCIEQERECDELLRSLSFHSEPYLGFDVEWKPNRGELRSKVALVQLSTATEVLLVRLCCMTACPPFLKEILENPRILKIGVAILADARLLWQDFGVEMRGCLDLQSLAHKYNVTESGVSLSGLAHSVLGKRLGKHHHIRCSNWEAMHLTLQQIHYAALDAWAGFRIFQELFLKHAESKNTTALEFCRGEVDTRPNAIKAPRKRPESAIHPSAASRPLKDAQIPVRKSDLYQNCRMLSPDGTVLCTCDRKKVDWYLKRNLADIVSEDPLTIKLRFQPAGRGKADIPYYMTAKENRCVGCGSYTDLCRHSVVPHCYRCHLPELLKSRNSHDIVLLCVQCTRKCTNLDTSRSQQLSKQYDAPLSGTGAKYVLDAAREKLKSAARMLLRLSHPKAQQASATAAATAATVSPLIPPQAPVVSAVASEPAVALLPPRPPAPPKLSPPSSSAVEPVEQAPEPQSEEAEIEVVTDSALLPPGRVEELRQTIRSHLGREDFTMEDLKRITRLDSKVPNPDWRSHGELVVAQLQDEAAIVAFIKGWRRHFLSSMQPKHLPPHWSVEHSVYE
jgi:hypothetical protein